MIHKLVTHIVKTTHTAARIQEKNKPSFQYIGGHPNDDPLVNNPELFQNILHSASADVPVFYSETSSTYYGIVLHKNTAIIFGPVRFDHSLSQTSPDHRIVYCDYTLFCEELLLLHNLLNGQNRIFSEVNTFNFGSTEMNQNVKRELSHVYFRYQEKGIIHNPYDQEIRELNSIRQGNVEQLKACLDEVFDGEYATLSKSPLRSIINLSIVSLGLTARAAIDGGMLPEDSFSLNDSYILQIDSATSIGQVIELGRRAKIEYATIVNQLQRSSSTHYLIEKTKNLIHKHMHEKIIIKDLAKELHVTPEYLSSLFHREEGITINDYIMKSKIQLSENLLMYSNYSFDEISYYFGFCSQSHYGKIFKKWTNFTPKQFRIRFGNPKFINEFEKIRDVL
mgnify:CR=1 FL=1